jgi:hypothetical protein
MIRAMQLTKVQKRALIDDGYLHLPGVVPRVMVDEAVRAINNDVGKGMDPKEMWKFHVQTFCPSLTSSPAIVELVTRTPALALAASAIGARLRTPTGAQIALRFPGFADPPKPGAPHIDGIPNKERTNGVPEGTILSFTALACVLLSELPGPYAGNFTVWPGSHRQHAEWIRKRGFRALLDGQPKVDYAPPVQIVGKPGDVVIAHYLLGHSVAANVSPNIRYACFFRLEVDGLAEHREASVKDPWRDWEGMHELLAAPPKPTKPTKPKRRTPSKPRRRPAARR